MSFLRRLRRDKEGSPIPEESKGEPDEGSKGEPTDDDVRVYGADERPLASPRPKPTPPKDEAELPPPRLKPAPTAAVRSPEPMTRTPVSTLPTDPALPALPTSPSGESPTPPKPAPGTLPAVRPLVPSAPASSGPPPPLPERGPLHPPDGAGAPGASGSCFVCGTSLDGRFCSVCQMTWVE